MLAHKCPPFDMKSHIWIAVYFRSKDVCRQPKPTDILSLLLTFSRRHQHFRGSILTVTILNQTFFHYYFKLNSKVTELSFTVTPSFLSLWLKNGKLFLESLQRSRFVKLYLASMVAVHSWYLSISDPSCRLTFVKLWPKSTLNIMVSHSALQLKAAWFDFWHQI